MYSPQTNIRLLSTPLENDYSNTLTWTSKSAQTQYFLSKTVYAYPNCTYQRKGNYIRIDRNIEDLYNCNYVMYQNSAYTDKWFYAFISDLEYIGDEITYVYLVPDEMQTWYFDVSFKKSYVVREHTNDDTIGSNQTDENIGTGSYICNKKEKMYTDNMTVCILKPLNADTTDVSVTHKIGTWYTVTNPALLAEKFGYKSQHFTVSYPQGATFYVNNIEIYGNETAYGFASIDFDTTPIGSTGEFDLVVGVADVEYLNHNWLGYIYDTGTLDSTTQINSWFKDLADKSLLDDIGAFYLAPNIPVSTSDVGKTVTKLTTAFTPVHNLDGYVPKNNKLFCYPYTIIKVHNASDSNRVLQPELFYNFDNMSFEYWTDKMPSSSVIATPLNYAGARHSLEYSINSAKYPLSSASYDTFKNYLGIHAREYNIQVASSLRSGAISIGAGILGNAGASGTTEKIVGQHTNKYFNKAGELTGSTRYGRQRTVATTTSTPSYTASAGNIVSGATEIAGTLAEVNARQKEAFATIGTVSNSNLNASGDLNIYIEQQSVNSDYAKRIDDYFSMYGYKTNLLKVPNITGRRNWNYVQIMNANVVAEIPNDSLDTIRDQLSRGVTFWHNPDTMYDYSQDNSII